MTKQILKKALKSKNVKFLAKLYFDIDLTPKQQEIVADIVFQRKRRITISAMTRYGKTYCVAIAVALFIMINKDKKIALIAPQTEQAQILRNYMTELLFKSDYFFSLAEIKSKGKDRLKKEASKKRQTFKNGCEYRVFSAEGEANRLMGFGVGESGGIIVKDEACLISREANAKITRMLGDNPEESVLIELYNPWDRDNVAFEHSIDPNFKHYHIGYELAIKEGRTTREFVEEQRKELTPLEFTVLYESDFPEESEDSLFNLAKINIAKNQDFGFEKELKKIEKILEKPYKHTEKEVNDAKKELKKFKRIISCDPADQGLDYTVIYWGVKKENKYQIIGGYSEPKSEPMEVVGRIFEKIKENYNGKTKTEVNIDRIGIGSGPLSRLKELVEEKRLKNVKIIGCHFGEQAIKKDHFINKKAENYFRLRSLFNEEMIDIPDDKELINELMKMKWKLTSSSKKKIEDPEKSPDFCFTGDTLITTINGDIPIKDIKEGTKVLTPFGFRKVLAKSKRKVNKIIETKTNKGNILKSTPEHKIYDRGSFKKAKHLKYTSVLENSNIINLLKWRIKNLFNTKERNIGFREMVDTSIKIIGKTKKDTKKHSIEKYGKIITIKKFLRDLLFTILMEIPLIIIQKILNLWKIKNTDKDTLKKNLKMKNIERGIMKTLKKLKRKLKNGTNQKKEESGIKNTTKTQLQKYQKEDIYVNNAERSINQNQKKQNFVQENVLLRNIWKMVGIVNIENVLIAIKSIIKDLNILKERPVQQNVLHYSGKGINVYNLTVNKDKVYYANNLLVSNCDSAVFLIWEDKEKLAFGFLS